MAFLHELIARLEQGPVGPPGDAADGPPAGPPPGFELPPLSDDFDYPESSLQQAGLAITLLFPALALVAVLLRVYTRVSMKQFGWDDVFICLAMANAIASAVVSYIGIRKSFLGIHVYEIPLEADPREGMRWAYYIQLLYNPTLGLVKTSLLLFLLRLSGQIPSIRWSIHVLNAFNIALMIAIFIVVIFQCNPISYFWESAGRVPPTEGSCVDQGVFYTSTAALAAFTDILVLALPFRIFLGLQMPTRVKWALIGVFLLGGIVTVVSILRLVWLVETFFHEPSEDPTYDIRFTYSSIETNLAIIAASAPVLRGLFGKWFPKIFSTLGGSHRTTYPDGSKGPSKSSRSGTGNSSSGHHTETFQLKSIKNRSEIRSYSPTASEEEIMTYNGIIRTREVDVQYDGRSTNEHDRYDHGEEHSYGGVRSKRGRGHRAGIA